MALRTRNLWPITRALSVRRRRATGCSSGVAVAPLSVRLAVLVVASSLSMLSLAPAATSLAAVAPTIYFYPNIPAFISARTPPAARPSLIPLTEDGASVLEDLHWTGWGSSVARATGVSSSSTCNPSCGTGRRVKSPVEITVSDPGRFQGYEVYRCFQLTFPAFPRSDEYACIGRLAGGYGYVYAKKVVTPTSSPRTPTPETTAARLACVADGYPVGSTNLEGLHCAVTSFRQSPVDPDYAVVWLSLANAQGRAESDSAGALVNLATGTVVIRPNHLFGVCRFGYVPPPQVPPAVLANFGLPIACAATTPPATTTPPSLERSEALAVNALLAESTNDRNEVRSAISALTSCANLAGEAVVLQSVASSRQSLLGRLENLDLAQLPNGAQLQSVLGDALSYSVQADEDFASWAQDLLSDGCSTATATNDPDYQAATQPDNSAEAAKAVFAGLWDPVARQFGLPAQTDNSF